MNEASALTPQTENSNGDTSEATMMFGFWYPAVEAGDLRKGEMRAVTLLETALVVGLDASGHAFALADRCPHRAMPLSFGRVAGSEVECCYHGWTFDCQTGQCCSIPALAEGSNVKIERILAKSYPCEKHNGTIWVFLADEFEETQRPKLPELPVFSDRYKSMHHAVEFSSDVDQGILGLLDPAHGPYVHQSWYWRSAHKLKNKEKTFEPIPNGFRMVPHAPSANSTAYKLLGAYGQPVTTTIEFVLPNMRTETIRCGKLWFTNRTTVTPITRDRCRLDFWAAWNLFRWVPFVKPIFRSFAQRFIAQDQLNAERQAVGLRREGTNRQPMILIGDADRQARWYFELKEAWLRSRQTKEPMTHPLQGPVTLRWRT